MKKWELSRRTFLRGLGATIALPTLEAMLPGIARAQAVGGGTPRRLLFFFVPNGIWMDDWTPSGEGAGYRLSPLLEPLAPYKEDFLVLSGLDCRPGEDPTPGNHARGTAAILTCVPPVYKESGELEVGISVDQVAANAIGSQTRFPSLELGAEQGPAAGACDAGYPCAYTNNVSWSGPSSPVTKEIDPKLVFDRLFAGQSTGETSAQIEARTAYRKSILDFVSDDARRLQSVLGKTDRLKLDEYLTGIREIERRLDVPQATCTPGERPGDDPGREERGRLMCDLIALAFQCDLTRVATFMLANGQSNLPYSFLGVGEGHHELSHHRGVDAYISGLKKINRWEVEQFAYLLGRLKGIQEGEGTVLDNSLVLFTSELSDGNKHVHINLPVVLAGRGGGEVTPGRHVVYQGTGGEFPIADLYISMLANVGVSVPSFGRTKDGSPYGTKPLAGLS